MAGFINMLWKTMELRNIIYIRPRPFQKLQKISMTTALICNHQAMKGWEINTIDSKDLDRSWDQILLTNRIYKIMKFGMAQLKEKPRNLEALWGTKITHLSLQQRTVEELNKLWKQVTQVSQSYLLTDNTWAKTKQIQAKYKSCLSSKKRELNQAQGLRLD